MAAKRKVTKQPSKSDETGHFVVEVKDDGEWVFYREASRRRTAELYVEDCEDEGRRARLIKKSDNSDPESW